MQTIEEFVFDLYQKMNIQDPHDLNYHKIADLLNVDIVYKKNAFAFDNEIILERGASYFEWTSFAHELCHLLRHEGNQMDMYYLFSQLQEYQADYFAHHFCVPSFMLERLDIPNCLNTARAILCEVFNVDPVFAEKRLEMWKNANAFNYVKVVR